MDEQPELDVVVLGVVGEVGTGQLSGSWSKIGTTITVGSLGISLYIVEETTNTSTPAPVVQIPPRLGDFKR
ncbi:hypothetical protein AWC22_17355 [Mycobacterium riyadhense]|uniref:Uncharacterized protein n=1 Tax=Mycobacterium riyadhense TaxID=486698 RepID=A0A1X2D0S5_9MYCO|nr:hypothetical protein [Mycobacterium riyadhense]ORW81279.1 hypothetical protein AWC22_17355 [Mycobacterium riyadhense]